MNKNEIKKKLKEDALLNTAFELFTSQGLTKTTINDIVNKAGVAKGTFYLYFTDKYDIRNKLIAHKAAEMFRKASSELVESGITDFEDSIIFIADKLIDQLSNDKSLLTFISKNLSWGIFKTVLINSKDDTDIDFRVIFWELFEKSPMHYDNPEILIFMIIELVRSTSYSTILYNEPVSIDELKPFLFSAIRSMIHQQARIR